MTEKKMEKEKKAKEKKTAEAPKKAPKGVLREVSSETSTKAECISKSCPVHGNLKVRGRSFEGRVTKKFPKRVVIEFERMVYIRKYERYKQGKTKIHARLPDCMEADISIGDLIKVQECRPLSKIIHFVVIGKVGRKKK